jgi:hypothetical protein
MRKYTAAQKEKINATAHAWRLANSVRYAEHLVKYRKGALSEQLHQISR